MSNPSVATCEREMEILINSIVGDAYQTAGYKLTAETRHFLETNSWAAPGDLSKSIGYVFETEGVGPVKRTIEGTKYQFKAVPGAYNMLFGSAVPYAQYVENGSAPLSGRSGGGATGGKFRDNINAWMDRLGIPEDDYMRRENMINYIAEHGTPAKHFMPSPQVAARVVKEAFIASTAKARKALPKIVVNL